MTQLSVEANDFNRAYDTSSALAALLAPLETLDRSSKSSRIILQGGRIVDGTGGPEYIGDVVVQGERIVIVQPVAVDIEDGDEVFDCRGLIVMPGFIDSHSHADGAVFEERVALGLLREGVTTVICGQDGVSYAPGNGAYASEYFAAVNGVHPTYIGERVADLLATYDEKSPINVGYLIPHGTIRYEVMGMDNRAATETELATMTELVKLGLKDGALGLSTGFDYVPSLFADAVELGVLTTPVKEAGAIYVTHMRGGYETNAHIGMEEIRSIVAASGVSVHVSHFHGPRDVVVPLVDAALHDGIDLSFDAYPYLRGSTLLAMPILPADLMSKGHESAIQTLSDSSRRQAIASKQKAAIESRPDMGSNWSERATLSYIASPSYAWAEGLTVQKAAERAGKDPLEFSLEILAASRLAVLAVFELPTQRPIEELAAIMQHDVHMVGSDGIYMGSHPHPRGWGTFTRVLAIFTRERSDYSWPVASQHLSANAADRHGLGDRGRLLPGFKADIVIVNPETVQDLADYDNSVVPSVGIDTVWVNGACVLRDGKLTGTKSGRGLRRSARVRSLRAMNRSGQA
jgi:N-acyl-D-amino-acid deacylase